EASLQREYSPASVPLFPAVLHTSQDLSDRRKQESSHPPADQHGSKLPQPTHQARSGWGVEVEGEAYGLHSSDATVLGMSPLAESTVPAKHLFALQFGDHGPENRHSLLQTLSCSSRLPDPVASAHH